MSDVIQAAHEAWPSDEEAREYGKYVELAAVAYDKAREPGAKFWGEMDRKERAQFLVAFKAGASLSTATEGAGVAVKPLLDSDEPGRMRKVSDVIAYFTDVKARFGDSCVYIRRGGVAWGAVALNREADDEKHGVFDLQAQHDRDMGERLGQVQRLIDDNRELHGRLAALLGSGAEPVVEAAEDFLEYMDDGGFIGGFDAIALRDAVHAFRNGTRPHAEGAGEGWIEWKGGECPVPPANRVDYRMADGDEYHDIGAGELDWRAAYDRSSGKLEGWCIVAYRLAVSPTSTEDGR